ncbi:hypothetical protein CsSME_00001793 [Camellia sinensis var. sinensis]
MPDHRYVSDPDSPPPPREYAEGLLGVVASLEGMVLRRETMLCASGVQVPPLWTGPSRPSRAARRGVLACGRGRRRAPVRQDDKSSEEEESVHPQSETSAGRDDDSGSNAEDGGNAEENSDDGGSNSDDGARVSGAEAAQPKKVRRASRSRA